MDQGFPRGWVCCFALDDRHRIPSNIESTSITHWDKHGIYNFLFTTCQTKGKEAKTIDRQSQVASPPKSAPCSPTCGTPRRKSEEIMESLGQIAWDIFPCAKRPLCNWRCLMGTARRRRRTLNTCLTCLTTMRNGQTGSRPTRHMSLLCAGNRFIGNLAMANEFGA